MFLVEEGHCTSRERLPSEFAVWVGADQHHVDQRELQLDLLPKIPAIY